MNGRGGAEDLNLMFTLANCIYGPIWFGKCHFRMLSSRTDLQERVVCRAEKPTEIGVTDLRQKFSRGSAWRCSSRMLVMKSLLKWNRDKDNSPPLWAKVVQTGCSWTTESLTPCYVWMVLKNSNYCEAGIGGRDWNPDFFLNVKAGLQPIGEKFSTLGRDSIFACPG